jgi:hypothetical protein
LRNDSNVRMACLVFLFLLMTFYTLLPCIPKHAQGQDQINYDGTIVDQSSGEPIPNTSLVIYRTTETRRGWRRTSYWDFFTSISADENGSFDVSLQMDRGHLVVAYYDNPETPGFDYVPSIRDVMPTGNESRLDFTLTEGATIIVKKEPLFVESTGIPTSTFTVHDFDTREALPKGGRTLIYGDGDDTVSNRIGIPSNVIIVPANTPVIIKAQSSVPSRVRREMISNEFTAEISGGYVLAKGDSMELDLREFTLPSVLVQIEDVINIVETSMEEKESNGFFMSVERQRLARVSMLTDEAMVFYEQGVFESSFSRFREAYVEITNLQEGIVGMTNEASKAVSILIGFMAVSAVIFSNILREDERSKVLYSFFIYVPFLLILFFLHPGSKLLPFTIFVEYSAVTFLLVTVGSLLLPRLLRSGRSRTKASLKSLSLTLPSIAKRNLRRRKLRFGLTMFSVMILVSGFISLTSFTSGYGLTYKWVYSEAPETRGVLVRTPNPYPDQAVSVISKGPGVVLPRPMEENFIDWFEEREETLSVTEKYENPPGRQYRETDTPYCYANGVPIYGVMGIKPSLEADINSLDEALTAGEYLQDEAEGVMISRGLADRLGLDPGDDLQLTVQGKTFILEIVGIFDNDALESVIDLDGAPLLNRKIVDVKRVEQDGPDFIVEGLVPCSPDEVIVTTIRVASQMPNMGISRLSILVEEDLDLAEYSQMMALNRGLRVWTSTGENVYLAKLASYFEGKGLPITVPWIVVVLNVIVTMLNSYHERRREVVIYSFIGMNPGHISGIFLAEAAVIGVVGGSLGYLLGLSSYKLIYILSPAIQVKQKVSAIWSIAALAISLTAVLMGGVVALKRSTAITPSLIRKWKLEEGEHKQHAEPHKLVIPTRITGNELEEFMEYIFNKLELAKVSHGMTTSQIRALPTEDEKTSREVEFYYKSYDATLSGLYTRNFLHVDEGEDGYFNVTLSSLGGEEAVEKTGTFVRQIILEYSISRGRIKEEYG